MLMSLLLTQSGCVSRRLTIRTDPPGALVRVSGENIGFSPVSKDFTYYGTYEVELVKDGYETAKVYQKIKPPWYQRFPLDFVSDNFLPFRVTNRNEYLYRMKPKVVVPDDDILGRANGLRSEALIGR
jgi:hypothetical protein